MRTTKIAAGFLALFLLLSGAMPASAAPKKAAELPQQPITIEADELYFSDKTGEMFAQGNVIVTQAQTQIFADLMRGNDKETEIWIDGKSRFKDPLTDITGMKVRYNYGSKFGMMRDLAGKCGDMFVTGGKADFQVEKYTIYSASVTTCPSTRQVPDYRVTARKVDIWPGDKMIAYDAKIWIKNTLIYTMARYKVNLKERDSDEFPRLGFRTPDGLSIGQMLSYPFNENVSAYADLIYFAKSGFQPNFGILDQEKDYTMRLMTGIVRDENDNLIRKAPEFRFDLNPRRLGKLPVKYTFGASVGRWSDDEKYSWHQQLDLNFKGDPIYLDARKTWTLDLGTGISYIRESFDNTDQTVFRYNGKLTKKLSPVLTVWTEYKYTSNYHTIFAYGKPEVLQEGIAGISWKVNNRTTLSYAKSYDFGRSRVYEDYYTIKQNFHCWDTEVTYRAVKKELIWTFAVAKW